LRKTLPAVLILLMALRGAPALAQTGDGGPDLSAVKVRFGPLMLNPTISLTNIGVDRNVFNDPPDKAPKEDFTATVTPQCDFWLRLGPTWLSANVTEAINWYQKYSSERNATNGYKVGWNVPGSRVSLKLDAGYLNVKDRPGFEIDTRAGRTDTNVGGTVEYHAFSRSYIGVTATRLQTAFADDAVYNGTNLQTSLNRVDASYGVNFRHVLTPLTSITFSAIRSNADFEFSPERNTASTSALMTVAFQPAALLKGGFSLGYNDFNPDDPALPGYSGFVGTVDLTYVLLGSTRFAVSGGRGVQYSYDNDQPYYVQSRIGGSVAQQIFGPVDVQVRGDLAYLDYRNRAGVVVPVPARTDRVTTVGLGVGYHMGKDLRLALNVDQSHRDTQVVDHQYERVLVGAALTYGF
jgi:hypothetical protein